MDAGIADAVDVADVVLEDGRTIELRSSTKHDGDPLGHWELSVEASGYGGTLLGAAWVAGMDGVDQAPVTLFVVRGRAGEHVGPCVLARAAELAAQRGVNHLIAEIPSGEERAAQATVAALRHHPLPAGVSIDTSADT